MSQKIIALVVAAGSGSRIGGELPKQYLDLGGRPVLARTIEALQACDDISAVKVVINPEHWDLYLRAVDGFDLLRSSAGGSTRQESVCSGLEGMADEKPDAVLIHDAARPLIDPETVRRIVDKLQQHEAVVPVIPVNDALKNVRDGTIEDNVDRSSVMAVQTPQGFSYEMIREAHKVAYGQGLPDDAAVAQAAGFEVATVRGNPSNIKITTLDDYLMAQLIMEGRIIKESQRLEIVESMAEKMRAEKEKKRLQMLNAVRTR